MIGSFEKSEDDSSVTRSTTSVRSPCGAELLLPGILRFEDAIRGEENDVPGPQIYGHFIVFSFGKQAEGNALQADLLHLTVADQEGIRRARVGESELPCWRVVNGEQQSNESRVKPCPVQAAI